MLKTSTYKYIFKNNFACFLIVKFFNSIDKTLELVSQLKNQKLFMFYRVMSILASPFSIYTFFVSFKELCDLTYMYQRYPVFLSDFLNYIKLTIFVSSLLSFI